MQVGSLHWHQDLFVVSVSETNILCTHYKNSSVNIKAYHINGRYHNFYFFIYVSCEKNKLSSSNSISVQLLFMEKKNFE